MPLLSKTSKLWIQLTLSVALLAAELIIGYMVNSIALIADAFHMLNDVVSLFIAVYAVKLANSTDHDPKYTYGWQRAEVLGALINAVLLLGLCITILAEAVPRFFNPVEIHNPQLILIVGSMGLAFNVFGMFLFGGHGHSHSHGHDHDHGHDHSHDIESRAGSCNTAAEFQQSIIQEADTMRKMKAQISEQSPLLQGVQNSYDASNAIEAGQHNHTESGHSHSHNHDSHNANHNHDHSHSHGHGHSHGEGAMNMYGVYLHVLGDALANIAVIATALIIWLCDFKEKYLFDPIISILITLLIIKFTIPLIKSASFILLQGTPNSIPLDRIRTNILKIPGIKGIHELHVWQLSDTKVVASAHISVAHGEDYMSLAGQVKKVLHNHGVHSATIQPEVVQTSNSSAIALPESDEGHTKCLLSCSASCEPQLCCPPNK